MKILIEVNDERSIMFVMKIKVIKLSVGGCNSEIVWFDEEYEVGLLEGLVLLMSEKF